MFFKSLFLAGEPNPKLGGVITVDDIDQHCRRWRTLKGELWRSGGPCFGKDVHKLKYLAHGPLPFKCPDNPLDECRKQVCDVDMKRINTLTTLILERYTSVSEFKSVWTGAPNNICRQKEL